MGFANVPEDAAEFTDADIAALRALLGFIDDGLLDEQQALQLTRILGQQAARLAENQVETLLQHLDSTDIHGQERLAVGLQLTERLLPDMGQLLTYSWQRALGAAVHRLDPAIEASSRAFSAIGFADLVDFTRLSRQLNNYDLMQLVDRFEARASDLIAEHGARLIKSLGDEVLFAADDPTVIAETGLRLVEHFDRDHTVPSVRVGLDLGTVVSHAGDLFGTTVNLASRLTALAEPGTALAGPHLVEALHRDPAYDLTLIGAITVRGIGPITPALLRRPGAVR